MRLTQNIKVSASLIFLVLSLLFAENLISSWKVDSIQEQIEFLTYVQKHDGINYSKELKDLNFRYEQLTRQGR